MSQIIEPANEIDEEITEWLEENFIPKSVFELLYDVAVKQDLKLTYKSLMETLDTEGVSGEDEIYKVWFLIDKKNYSLTDAAGLVLDLRIFS